MYHRYPEQMIFTKLSTPRKFDQYLRSKGGGGSNYLIAVYIQYVKNGKLLINLQFTPL